MKKLVVISNLAFVLLLSCTTQKMGTSTYTDDVYANPKEDRMEEARLAAERKQAKDAADKRYNDSIAAVKQAQKEKDDANPYYKDREFKYDDYYDYEYATRVKRFNNNINGLSYYDNYYTNSYWYNQNPYNYGVSVYNGYSWWGSSYNNYSYNPSINFYSNYGWGCNPYYGYNGYNPYMAGYAAGYNNGFNNGLYGNYYGYGNPYGYNYGMSFGYGYGNYGYNPYGYGYGYNNPYYNTWGYYNSYDNNSSYTYGPRSSHGGGNSRRTSNPGVTGKRDSYYEKYVDAVVDQQVRAVKFSDIPTRGNNNTNNEPIRVNNNGTPMGNGTGTVRHPNTTRNEENNAPIRSVDPGRIDNPTRNTPVRDYNSNTKDQSTQPGRLPDEAPVRQNPIKTNEPIKHQNESAPRIETPRYETAPVRQGNIPGNNGGGGGNTPSNNGGGHRPR